MEKHFDKRTDPAKLVDGARSVISVLLNYYPSRRQQHPDAPFLSIYAYGKDYHEVMRKKLNSLLQFIQITFPPVTGRGFVDSAPVLDRAWAARSGLGWIGKNTNLISPEAGSYFFIGSLIIDIPLRYDKPITDFCGDCNRCIRACPTSAIVSDHVIDASRCISYLTIENKGEINEEFSGKIANRAFGCDICQEVCPWNRKSTPHQVKEFEPIPGLLEMTRKEWYDLDEDKFREKFSKSAVKRTKFSGLRRNLRFIGYQDDE
jgi:epoxyqueuosine reductase